MQANQCYYKLTYGVQEVVNNLMDKDLISQSELRKLKGQKTQILDPNLVMDLRHKEVQEKRKERKNRSLANKVNGKRMQGKQNEQHKINISSTARTSTVVAQTPKVPRKSQSSMDNKSLTERAEGYRNKSTNRKKMTEKSVKNEITSERERKRSSKAKDIIRETITKNIKAELKNTKNETRESPLGYASSCDSGYTEIKKFLDSYSEDESLYDSAKYAETDSEKDWSLTTQKMPSDIEQQSQIQVNNESVVLETKHIILQAKYWWKWRDYLLKRKSKKIGEKTKLKKLNFKEVRHTKKSLSLQRQIIEKNMTPIKQSNEQTSRLVEVKKSVHTSEKFDNRLRAQRHIIEKQRMILEEQNKKIKVLEEEQKKINEKKTQLLKSRCKVKEDIKATKEKNAKSLLETPKFLENMNRRAEERRQKREQLEILRKMREEENQVKIIQEAEEKRKREEEKKLYEIQEEQMRYLKQLVKEQTEKREKENNKRAIELLYNLRRRVILEQCFNHFKNLLIRKRAKEKEADDYRNKKIVKSVFLIWRETTLKNKQDKIKKADEFYITGLMKKSFIAFQQNLFEMTELKQVADDYKDLTIIKKAFESFKQHTKFAKKKTAELIHFADKYYKRKLLRRAFQAWKTYPQIKFEEWERQRRMRSWAEKVKEIIPDFTID